MYLLYTSYSADFKFCYFLGIIKIWLIGRLFLMIRKKNVDDDNDDADYLI